MAYATLTVSAAWPGSAQYTASGETDVRLVNPSGRTVYWVTASSAPTLAVNAASPLHDGAVADITLDDGEELWVAAPSLGGDTASITLMS